MWLMFFVMGGFWFWSLLALEFILLIWFVEQEWGWASWWSLVGFIVMIHLFGDAKLLIYIKDDPQIIIYGMLAYIGIGFVWSTLKFRFALSKYRDKIDDLRDKWKERGNDVNDDKGWRKYLSDNTSQYDVPKFSEYKDKIVFWWAYWPPSLLWTLCHDFVERFFKELFKLVQKFYRQLFDATVGKVIQEVQNAHNLQD